MSLPANWGIAYAHNVPALLQYACNAYNELSHGSEASVALCDWLCVNEDRLEINWNPPWDVNDPAEYENWQRRASQIKPNHWQVLGNALSFASLKAGSDSSVARQLIQKLSELFVLDSIETKVLELVTRDNTDISVAALIGALSYTPKGVRPLKFKRVYALLLGAAEDEISEAFEQQGRLIQNGLLVISQNPEVFPKSTIAQLVWHNEFIRYGIPLETDFELPPNNRPDWDC